MSLKNQYLTIGISGAMSVGLGALAAHALKVQMQNGLISVDELNGFDTAAKYQMYHTLAMLAVVIINEKMNSKLLKRAYQFFLIGIICFSGSLYFLCTRHLLGIEQLKYLGPITPIGGLFFMAAWLCLAFSFFKKDKV